MAIWRPPCAGPTAPWRRIRVCGTPISNAPRRSYRKERLAECQAALEAAMELGAHQNPNAWLMLGDTSLRLSDWNRAGPAFAQAAERFPFLGQAFVGLAIARTEQGRLEEPRTALGSAR